ncbi:MAG: LamG-like jellyroll fold domain-containing protein [Bacilli bacterium]
MKNKSFTLIELLVVIVIIGILAGVIMISTSSSINKANLARGKVFSENIKKDLFFNIVSEWNFDDSYDIGKDDVSINDLTFYNFSSESGDSCLFTKCIYSAGADIAKYGINNVFPMPVSNLTIDVWFKMATNVSSTSSIISYAVGSSTNELLLCKEGTNLSFYVNGSNRIFPNIKMNDDNWHNIVIVRQRTAESNANNLLYFDGAYINNNPDTSGDLTTGGCLVIGQDQDAVAGGFDASQAYKGYLDDIRIYDTVLSSSYIKSNYIGGLNKLLSSGKISKIEYNKRIK